MSGSLLLPTAGGVLEPHELGEPGRWGRPSGPPTSRRAFAAAHVVPLAGADNTPGAPAALDWEATLALRHDLWSWGFGVAEAMDTSQRGTDHLDLAQVVDLDSRDHAGALAAVVGGYREQLAVCSEAGAQPIVMASRVMAAVGRSAQDYLDVYGEVIRAATAPVILHWLGPAFDPALAGYWGGADVAAASETFLQVLAAHAEDVDGVKVSLLDASHEIGLRRRMPAGVRMYTGDDFNYPDLVVGDAEGHSDALLGIFAAVAPSASAALQALDAGESARAHELLASSQELSRHVFAAPTFHYKTGIAFLSWLNGQQAGFQMVGGLHAGRSPVHLAQLVRLADRAGLLRDPDLASHRMTLHLEQAGFDVRAGRR